MKKEHLIMAIAALAIAGCSQNEVMEVSPDAHPSVGFGVYNEVQTRGAVTDINTLKTGFGVFAYHTKTTAWSSAKTSAKANFMYNQKVTSSDGTTWAYNPVKYWPMDNEKITFFAYAPHSTLSNGKITFDAVGTMTAAPKVKFELDAVDKMIDLVVAENVASGKSNPTQDLTYTTNGTSGVKFNFKHALSRLTFIAKTSAELATVTGTKGTTCVYVKSAKIVQGSSANLYKSGVFDCESATWTTKTAATADYAITDIMNLESQAAVPSSLTNYKAIKLTSSTNTVPLFKPASGPTPEQYLFLIPETIKTGAGTVADKVQIEFSYDIITTDNAIDGGYTVTSHTSVAKLPAGALKQGTAYKYTVTFGINEVKIATPDIEIWGTETTADAK